MDDSAFPLPLDFVGDDSRIGFRLHRLEVLNWGTFHDRIWTLDLDGRTGLLTGDIGSGKSTLVDAVTSLLVPAHRIAYNKAAGAETRERTLRTYVLGHYKSEGGENGGRAKPVGLRDDKQYSVILGVFRNEAYDQTITLAQFFWFKDPNAQPARFYVMAEQALSIADDFSGFGADVPNLRKILRAKGCEIHDSHPPYSAWFCRRFGIKDDQALELFHQTVSMKSVGNLTDFVRTHMLEPADIDARVDALILHFDDLKRAHDAVLRAREQVKLLEPLVESGQRHRSLEAEIAAWQAGRDALRRHFAGIKTGLLTARLDMLTAQEAALQAEVAQLVALRDSARDAVTALGASIGANGGDRLDALTREIGDLEPEKTRRRHRADRYAALLKDVGDAALPASAAGFIQTQQTLGAQRRDIDIELANLNDRLKEEEYTFRQLKDRHGALDAEIRSLEKRSSNIDSAQIDIRATLCQALDLTEADLPFAGELFQVRAEERDWHGAAERLLRGFGLSLLVPEAHYAAVSDWVDRSRLRGRLVYYQLRSPRPAQGTLHPQALYRKLQIKPDAPAYDWLEQELRQRANIACCDDLASFRRETRALTRAGQIKEPGGRHEKDDRHRLDDRSRYVLGWSNLDKLQELRDGRAQLEAQLGAIAQGIGKIQSAAKLLDHRKQALAKLEEVSAFDEIDWQAVAQRIARLTDERQALESAADTLHQLRLQQEEAKRRVAAHDAALDQKHSAIGTAKGKFEAAQQLYDEAAALAATASLDAAAATQLTAWCSEALDAAAPTVENCDRQEQQVRAWLQARVDAAIKRLQRLSDDILSAMHHFRTGFAAEAREVDVSLAALPDFEAMLARLQSDGLPRFEARFKELLNVNTINEIAQLNAQFNRQMGLIQDRIAVINASLHGIDYNPGRFICLKTQPSADAEIRDFRQDLRACTEGATDAADEQYSEAKFHQVLQIVDRLRGRDGLVDADRRWRDKVTDVRNAFVFSASERWRADETEAEHYSDSGGKSGGQKEKLAYTVLASSLAYRFGLDGETARARSFRFVVIDEAFGRGSDESARYGLTLFQKLNLQLLIVTPLQKIHVIEPFVASVGFVHNEGGQDSQLRSMSIDAYRALKPVPRGAAGTP